ARCIELLCLAIHHLTQPLDEYQPVRLTTSDRGVIEKARDLLVKDYAQAPSVSQLSKSLGVNKNKLFYGFKMLFGLTISEFIQEQRLNEGKRLLQQSELPISEIANQVGFKHQSNFATAMKKHFGMTPRQFRE
ncbi:MAG: AraC family transcriptional regulator, partial [Pseudomonadota bacterium]